MAGIGQERTSRASDIICRMSGPPPAVDIRPATVGDVTLILRFIKELAAYERAEQEVVATESTLRSSLFGKGAQAHALICRVAGVDAGFAVYFFNYSTWQGRQGLYLEDLYVSPAPQRGCGQSDAATPGAHGGEEGLRPLRVERARME